MRGSTTTLQTTVQQQYIVVLIVSYELYSLQSIEPYEYL